MGSRRTFSILVKYFMYSCGHSTVRYSSTLQMVSVYLSTNLNSIKILCGWKHVKTRQLMLNSIPNRHEQRHVELETISWFYQLKETMKGFHEKDSQVHSMNEKKTLNTINDFSQRCWYFYGEINSTKLNQTILKNQSIDNI